MKQLSITYVLSTLSVSVDSVGEVAELEQALLRRKESLCHHEWAEWHFYLLRMHISYDLDTFEVDFGAKIRPSCRQETLFVAKFGEKATDFHSCLWCFSHYPLSSI